MGYEGTPINTHVMSDREVRHLLDAIIDRARRACAEIDARDLEKDPRSCLTMRQQLANCERAAAASARRIKAGSADPWERRRLEREIRWANEDAATLRKRIAEVRA